VSLPPRIKSPVAKRSVFIGPRKSSITMETSFWEALKEIAASESLTLGQLVTRIDSARQHANLSSAVRLYVLDHYRRLVELALAAGGAKGKR
jgi:predicted DNA-binding ribbon-helix-helix protein